MPASDWRSRVLPGGMSRKKGIQSGLPGDPVVKTSPPNAGGVALTPGQRAKTPQASKLKYKREAIL